MRLTVHLENVPKKSVEFDTKDGVKKKSIINNTLSFNVKSADEVNGILKSIKPDQGTVTKHYLSNSKIVGRAKGKKKVA
jgi:hypothetical protein